VLNLTFEHPDHGSGNMQTVGLKGVDQQIATICQKCGADSGKSKAKQCKIDTVQKTSPAAACETLYGLKKMK
jgi:hypothetical protein